MTDKTKILVVDDEMPVAMMMAFLLTRAGCETKTALNVEKALRLAQTERFDLITLDLDMPDINGFELFQRLKQIPHLTETPMIFVSGRATIENQQYALNDLGAADFIEKPFGVEFAPRILSHLTRKASNAYTDNEVPVES
jgi:two-component system catabolic regulation response regulator CreB